MTASGSRWGTPPWTLPGHRDAAPDRRLVCRSACRQEPTAVGPCLDHPDDPTGSSGPVASDATPNVRRVDPSGADQSDAERQATDLAVGVSPSWPPFCLASRRRCPAPSRVAAVCSALRDGSARRQGLGSAPPPGVHTPTTCGKYHNWTHQIRYTRPPSHGTERSSPVSRLSDHGRFLAVSAKPCRLINVALGADNCNSNDRQRVAMGGAPNRKRANDIIAIEASSRRPGA
jgi:hypothetical protein